jgi:hypothetical protein
MTKADAYTMSTEERQLPRYKCHKEVGALKIVKIEQEQTPTFDGPVCRGSMALGTGCGRCESCRWEAQHGTTPKWWITVADEGYGPIIVDAAYIQKHNPQPGGYYIVYPDGYKSFSPAQAFEEGYTLITADEPIALTSETARAFAVLRQAMHDDPEYAWSWHCNIAMASVDEGRTHFQANRAAARFMQNCFGIDITKSPQWASMGFPATETVDVSDQTRT